MGGSGKNRSKVIKQKIKQRLACAEEIDSCVADQDHQVHVNGTLYGQTDKLLSRTGSESQDRIRRGEEEGAHQVGQDGDGLGSDILALVRNMSV